MRVLMVTATYVPSANGVAVSIENLKNSLKKLGHEVRVLAPNGKNSKKEKDVLRYPSLKNPFVSDYPIPIFPGFKSINKIISTFKPEIVHAHHPFQVGFFSKFIADRLGVPLVFTYHTMYGVYATKYARFLPKKLKVKFIEKSVNDFCKKADLIIAPSNFLKKELSKKYGEDKIVAIPSALPILTKSKSSKMTIRKQLNLPANKKILLTVSRIAKEKNMEILIKSLKHLPENFVLLAAGSGPDEKSLRKLAERLNMQEKIIFVGKVQHSKINLYYQSADIFYYASQSETQGIVFLEAMHFGLPIIAVDSPAAREWIGNDVGIIVKNNPRALAKKALYLSKETNLNKFQVAAKKYVKNFTQAKKARAITREYKRLVGKKK